MKEAPLISMDVEGVLINDIVPFMKKAGASAIVFNKGTIFHKNFEHWVGKNFTNSVILNTRRDDMVEENITSYKTFGINIIFQ